uniref:Uncharacterized protein n=1 Tax=Anguilla anguilla TaxID=7936 RepID=A0A0E9P8L2_ANGAN
MHPRPKWLKNQLVLLRGLHLKNSRIHSYSVGMYYNT